jgi:hypothetical protein
MIRAITRVGQLSAERRRYLGAALWHLLAAKVLHLRLSAPRILARLREKPGAEAAGLDPALMHWALYGVGRRLPWRSDCLIQALAAKRWLDRAGGSATLRLGVRRTDDGGLMAHAWLSIGEAAISGGPIVEALTPLTGSTEEQDQRWAEIF